MKRRFLPASPEEPSFVLSRRLKYRYRLQSRRGTAFRLRWQEDGPNDYDILGSGTIDFQHTDAGLGELLGIKADELARLRADHVTEPVTERKA